MMVREEKNQLWAGLKPDLLCRPLLDQSFQPKSLIVNLTMSQFSLKIDLSTFSLVTFSSG